MFLGPLVGTVILRVLTDVTIAYTSHTELVLGIVILRPGARACARACST